MPKDVEQLMKESAIPEGGSISWCEPVIAGDKLIFGALDKHLYCLDIRTGKILWKFLTGGAIFSGAVVVKDRVFFSSSDKYLYCIELEDGALIWKKIFPEWPMSITFAENLYIGCNDSNVYCLSPEDGRMIWNFRTGGFMIGYPAVINSLIYCSSFDNNFYCLDLDGKMKWKFLTGGRLEWAYCISDESGQAWSVTDRHGDRNADGNIYLGSYDNCLYSLSLDGKFNWKFLTGKRVGAPPAVHDGNIYFGSTDKNFYSLKQNGVMNWRFVTGGLIDTPACIENNTAYFGCYDNSLYALNLDGTQAWKFLTGGPVMSPPVIIDGILYFGSWDSYLYAIRLRDKKVIWKFKTGSAPVPPKDFLTDFIEIVDATEKKPFSFSDWKPETLKKSYEWKAEVGNLITSPYKSENPYMNKPVYKMDNHYKS